MNLRQPLLTMLLALLLVQPATAWQYQPGPRPDPYAQPGQPNANGGFRFAPDPNAPPQQQAPPQPVPPQFAPPAPQPQFVPSQPQPPAGPPPVIPGYDPNETLTSDPQFDKTLFQPSQIVATVGNQYILYGDVEPTVNQMIAPALARASPAERAQIEAVRPKLIQQIVRNMVENKILYLEFEREMESKAGRDKMPEIRADITKKMRDNFEKQLLSTREKVLTATPEELQDLAKRDPIMPRLAMLMKEHQIETLADLDRILRQNGSTLEKQQRAYLESNLGKMNIHEKLKVKTEVSHLEMLNYYREHAEDFAVKAKARFEILSVKTANFPSREAALAQMVQMGNKVFYGTPFAAVAREGSQDINAAKGGLYDWTTEKSLASEQIDAAIFSQEVGKLSPIIEDARGFHIVRVIERQPAGFIPFTDAQVKIKELINQQRRDVAVKTYLASIREKTVVWTIYDPPPAASVATQPAANPQR